MDCSICFETVKSLGAPCSKCKNRCCISCESQLEKDTCPYCRTKLTNWFLRSLHDPELYCQEYWKQEQYKRQKYTNAQDLCSRLMMGDQKAFQQISNSEVDQEDILTILQTLRLYIYNSASIYESMERIDYLIELVEFVGSFLENYDSFTLDLEYVNDLMFEEQEREFSNINKKYQKNLFTHHKPKKTFPRNNFRKGQKPKIFRRKV